MHGCITNHKLHFLTILTGPFAFLIHSAAFINQAGSRRRVQRHSHLIVPRAPASTLTNRTTMHPRGFLLLLYTYSSASAFFLGGGAPTLIISRSRRTPSLSSSLHMSRDWFTDAAGEALIPDDKLNFVHDFLDNKGKNVVRGPAQVTAPDGRLLDVLPGEEVEIIGGMVYRTYLNGFPAVNEARLRQERQVVLEIKWGDNWETQGFTLEVMGVTGPSCEIYTNRFCEATGCTPKGPMVVKPAYFEVPLTVNTQNVEAVEKLRQVQLGTASIEF